MQKIAVIIPCYNEAKRLQPQAFVGFLQSHTDADLFFVNDGSTDLTLSILTEIKKNCPEQVQIISINKKGGKANAVREGLLATQKKTSHHYVGYLDADLSTSLTEFYRLYQVICKSGVDYLSGSRVKMLHTNIERSFFRHITGRIIATIIDSKYKLGIYDTQCGAKWFKTELIDIFCQEKFITKWFFDVEIFLRIKKNMPEAKGIEVPLAKWKDPGGSKINILDFPFVIKEIFSLRRKYRKP